MSLSVWLLSAGVVGICGFIFKKTVSNDAKNDFTLRDILTSDNRYEEEEVVETKVQDITKPKFFKELQKEEEEREPVATKTACGEPEREPSYAYSTNTYSTNTHTDYKRSEEKPQYQYDDEPIYYEKINDDACEPDYNDDYEEEDFKLEEEYDKTTARSIDYDDSLEDTKPEYKEQTVKKSLSRSLFDLIKTFWRGITFSIGALICLYSFYGVVAQAQTSNDALLYSIWLLIGVILIK